MLTGILRHYATVFLATPAKNALTPAESRERLSLLRGVNLRNNASAVLTPQSLASRKNFLITCYKEGLFLKDPEARGGGPVNPMTDPAGMDAMMGMMKGNMAMMIPQTLIMGWINAFFSGFVICMFCTSLPTYPGMLLVACRMEYGGTRGLTLTIHTVKLPFPLTIRFKSMLQSGVMTRDLDVRWVSSLSWYFLNLFGLQPVFGFILGGDNCECYILLYFSSLFFSSFYYSPQAQLFISERSC